MNLVNISKEDSGYKIKSVKYIKIFGTTVYSYDKMFRLEPETERWINQATQKRATEAESIKLNKWLKDHRKFIEKA